MNEGQDITALQDIFLSATLREINELIVTHCPLGHTQDFLLAVLNPHNENQPAFLKHTGLLKLTELSSQLLSSFSTTSAAEIANHVGALNAYFFFEIFSDNLATGLANADQFSDAQMLSKDILLFFNDIMIRKLRGDPSPTLSLLQSKELLINRISPFSKSLAANTISTMIVEANKINLLPLLLLNIEACLNLKNFITDQQLTSQFITSLTLRYEAGCKMLLRTNNLTLSSLLEDGKNTILIIPTLLFLCSAINEVIKNPKWQCVIQKNIFYEAIVLAAYLVRINNDIGTSLLFLDTSERNFLQQKLESHYQEQILCATKLTPLEYLANILAIAEFSKLFTRITKDINYGEFNIVLDPIRFANNNNNPIATLFSNIEFFSVFYRQQRELLINMLDKISNYLQTNCIGSAIFRIVTFHEQLYKHSFDSSDGEFASE